MTKPSGMRPRIATLDFARGIAILGILLLNISAFGLPKAAYLNPAFNGQLSSSDAWTWAVLDLVAQGKFLMMFAILFGGGLYLLLPRGKHWIQARLSLLLLCGLLHAAFFWDGDILLSYGLIGLVCWRLVREGRSSQSFDQYWHHALSDWRRGAADARVYQQSTARQLLVARPGAAAI
ncbi:putative membrane protein YeiB [Ewingella americana]